VGRGRFPARPHRPGSGERTPSRCCPGSRPRYTNLRARAGTPRARTPRARTALALCALTAFHRHWTTPSRAPHWGPLRAIIDGASSRAVTASSITAYNHRTLTLISVSDIELLVIITTSLNDISCRRYLAECKYLHPFSCTHRLSACSCSDRIPLPRVYSHHSGSVSSVSLVSSSLSPSSLSSSVSSSVSSVSAVNSSV